jgi:hypothetical protein
MNRPLAISRICALSIDGWASKVEAREVTHEREARPGVGIHAVRTADQI